MSQLSDLQARAGRIRRDVVRLSYKGKTGHIGSSLSCAELMAALFFRTLRLDPANPTWSERDRFLMSKGHACVPLYSCLAQRGLLPAEVLESFGVEGGALGHHPKRCPEFGIEFGTGSLGHGLSLGAGLAFSAKAAGKTWRAVVMMSDGEQQEGTVWEAAGFAAQHRLDNLLAIVDFNKMQALGDTKDISNLEPLHERWRAFGWGVRRVDGHDLEQIVSALDGVPFETGRPSVIVADTVKGKGVSFMEGSLLWHYRCPDATEYEAAMREASAMRNAVIRALVAEASAGADIHFITADLGFKVLDPFREAHPARFTNAGVSEANMLSVAAGMALSGKRPFCYSMVPFALMRPFEQFRLDVVAHEFPVTVIGVGGGLSYGHEGFSHHAIEDLAILRSLPKLQVLAPGDPHEATAAVRAALAYSGPTFIRLGQNGDPHVHGGAVDSLRRPLRVRGTAPAVSVLSTGHVLAAARDACERAARATGVDVQLFSVPTLKPWDVEVIAEIARQARALMTVEEHGPVGGLGTAVTETLFALGWRGRLERLSLPDAYCDTHGTLPWLRARYGLDAAGIARRLEELLQ